MARSILILCIILADQLLHISSSQALSGDSNIQSMNRKFGGMIVTRSVDEEGSKPAEGPSYLDVEGPVGELEISHSKKRSRDVDPSIAGGGVILGGLGTTFLVAIVCYIRATRRKSTVKSLSDSGSSAH